ncbi:MAG: aldehyde dehydrogenase family protein, partial [Actinobacteria bacterium]|nr:aldehyde dehydrogenase family protein [Actinomycetota bacterium]
MATRIKTFDSHYPVTGDVIGTFPIHTDAEVRVAVDQARIASDQWVALGFRGRRKV